ncbi:putative PfkB family kinase [Obelidium mucronatum]|nr:putative PfkB family kinase [Obelidium mucronatum]
MSTRRFPLEDQKMRANSIEKRRGGNGANVLQVLSQFQGSAGARLATFLVAVLAGAPDDAAPSFIAADLAASLGGVSLAHCVFRGAGFSEPTAWIVATGRTRTIINHTTLPELTHREFCASLAPALAAAARARESVWFHFEGRNPNRPGLDNLLPKADLLFFSKWYAEGRGFPNAPTGFLDNIRRECKPGAILFLTWAVQGCFFLVNETRKPAQTHHVPAPAIFPVDTIGAGDTFAAGILYGLGVMGWDVRTSTEFAVRLATAKCAQVGFDGLAERVF